MLFRSCKIRRNAKAWEAGKRVDAAILDEPSSVELRQKKGTKNNDNTPGLLRSNNWPDDKSVGIDSKC